MENVKNSTNIDTKQWQKMVTHLQALQQSLDDKDAIISQLKEQNQQLLEQFKLAQHKQFGKSTEVDTRQALLFDEAESVVEEENNAESDSGCIDPNQPSVKRKPKRQALPKSLPRKTQIHDIPEADKICSCCGHPRHQMGETKSEQLELIPAQVSVIEHIRLKYSCRHCEQHNEKTTIVTAALPPSPIPKSMATPSLLAFVMTNKYLYALPLYRQERLLQNHGIFIDRSTLSKWMLLCAQLFLPLYVRLHEILLQQSVIQADETPLTVIQEDKTNCYMWLYCSGTDSPTTDPPERCDDSQSKPLDNIVLYDYQKTRAGKCAVDFLQGFSGDLQVDGYKGYEQTLATLAGCWAHARRKFIEAQRVQVKGKTGKADWAINHIRKLYAIEKGIRDKSPEEKQRIRQEKSIPLLNQFKQWLDKSANQVVPKTAIGKAIYYSLNQWEKLIQYPNNGHLAIDNNRAERAIKPFVIGRKNWLFSQTKNGAQASAIMYSIIETAKANQLNPYDYVNHLLEQLAQKPDNVDHLLPWNMTESR